MVGVEKFMLGVPVIRQVPDIRQVTGIRKNIMLCKSFNFKYGGGVGVGEGAERLKSQGVRGAAPPPFSPARMDNI